VLSVPTDLFIFLLQTLHVWAHQSYHFLVIIQRGRGRNGEGNGPNNIATEHPITKAYMNCTLTTRFSLIDWGLHFVATGQKSRWILAEKDSLQNCISSFFYLHRSTNIDITEKVFWYDWQYPFSLFCWTKQTGKGNCIRLEVKVLWSGIFASDICMQRGEWWIVYGVATHSAAGPESLQNEPYKSSLNPAL
jgi:hypothetical protein